MTIISEIVELFVTQPQLVPPHRMEVLPGLGVSVEQAYTRQGRDHVPARVVPAD